MATAGNLVLLEILQDMSPALAEKSEVKSCNNHPRRFIYYTTGPKLVGQALQSRGYEPQVKVFSMCRPVRDLEKYLSVDDTGRVSCDLQNLELYDVWLAHSLPPRNKRLHRDVRDVRNARNPECARPLAQLPPFLQLRAAGQ